MTCNSLESCKGMNSCKGMKKAPDNSVGMDKRKDILEKGKSKEAFQHNVATEVKAGKPVKQAVAIAYSTKRHSDILPTNKYKNTIQSYGLSSLKNENGAVTSPQEVRQIAAQRSGQSYNKLTKDKSNYDRMGIRRK